MRLTRYARVVNTHGELGRAGLRGWPRHRPIACDPPGPVTDSSNLLRVIPAEGGTMNGVVPVTVAIVFAGSQPVASGLRDLLPEEADVVAADSGLRVAGSLGLRVDHLVGDLDSTDPSEVEAAVA